MSISVFWRDDRRYGVVVSWRSGYRSRGGNWCRLRFGSWSWSRGRGRLGSWIRSLDLVVVDLSDDRVSRISRRSGCRFVDRRSRRVWSGGRDIGSGSIVSRRLRLSSWGLGSWRLRRGSGRFGGCNDGLRRIWYRDDWRRNR